MKTVVGCWFVLGWLIAGDPAYGHDIYTAMTKGTPCTQCTGEECEPVEAIPITRADAVARHLKYRVFNWGALRDAESDGYFLPASGEFIPVSWSMPSADERFHRCTYPTNKYWSSPAEEARKGHYGHGRLIIIPHPDTLDHKPPTRCFFAPYAGM